MSSLVTIVSLVLVAVGCKVLWRDILSPHEHYYTTYHPGMCTNAHCICGSRITLEEAAVKGIPIYWKKTGSRVIWNPSYVRSLKEN